MKILVFDLAMGSVETLVPEVDKYAYIRIVGWSSGGSAVLYAAWGDRGPKRGQEPQLRAIGLDGKPDRVVTEDYIGGSCSPDGSLRLVHKPTEDILAIENRSTGDVANIGKSSAVDFLGWAPNSRMIVYRYPVTVRHEIGDRTKTLNTLWVVAPEPHKLNRMCVALDSDESGEGLLPTWSSDSMKMTYIWRGRAYVAELARRAPSASEKLAAGIPLTEEEEKEILLWPMPIRSATQCTCTRKTGTANSHRRITSPRLSGLISGTRTSSSGRARGRMRSNASLRRICPTFRGRRTR